MTAGLLNEHVMRAVWTVAGLLFGFCSFLVTDKVEDIAESMKGLKVIAQQLQIEQAVIKRDVDQSAIRLNTHQERIYRLESVQAEIRAKVGVVER